MDDQIKKELRLHASSTAIACGGMYVGDRADVIFTAAVAFWHGQGIYPHSTEELTAENLKGHPTGVLPIVKTKNKELYHNGRFINVRVID